MSTNNTYFKYTNSQGELWIILVDENGLETHIPTVGGNRYYQEYLKWVAEGNETPERK